MTELEQHKTNIIAVPVSSEEAFKPIQKAIDDGFLFDNYYKNANNPRHGTKMITNQEDYDKLVNMTVDINAMNTERYITPHYTPKPFNQNVPDYIANYLKSRGLNSYYTFREWYDIFTDINGLKLQWYIIPLYIRLKNNKSFEQMKVIRYVPKTEDNPDGFVVEEVNKEHFIRDPQEEPDVPTFEELEQYKEAEQEEVYEDIRIHKQIMQQEAERGNNMD